MNSDPFHVDVIAASEVFFIKYLWMAIAAVQFVPASAADTPVEFKKSLTDTVPNCGASLHPCA